MGINKFELPLGDKPFLEYVTSQLLSSFDGPVIAVASQSTVSGVTATISHLESERIRIVIDQRDNSGPLEGIRVGLEAAEAESEWAFVTSCDVPLLSRDVLQVLQNSAATVDDSIEALIPQSATRIYGMTALYRPSVHKKVDALIERGSLKVSGLATELNAKMLELEDLSAVDPALDSVRNLNSPDHYMEFLREKGFDCPPEIKQRLHLGSQEFDNNTKQS